MLTADSMLYSLNHRYSVTFPCRTSVECTDIAVQLLFFFFTICKSKDQYNVLYFKRVREINQFVIKQVISMCKWADMKHQEGG